MNDQHRKAYKIPDDILDDLCVRFIVDVPTDDLQDHRRFVFVVEQAHWFYEDNYVSPPDEDDDDDDDADVQHYDVKSVSINNFIRQVYQHCPELRSAVPDLDEIIRDWHKLKALIPSYGAILLNSSLTKVVLVQSMSQKANWGFPKGKRNENELECRAAAREVREETGFDITSLMHSEVYLESVFGTKMVRLYLVPHVPDDTKFAPRTRGEIKDIQWFDIQHLPQAKRDPAPRHHLGLAPNSFFMVYPFIYGLRRWLEHYRSAEEKRQLELQKREYVQGTMNAISDLLSASGRAPTVSLADVGSHKDSMKLACQIVKEQQVTSQPTHRQHYEQRPSSRTKSPVQPRTHQSPQPRSGSQTPKRKRVKSGARYSPNVDGMKARSSPAEKLSAKVTIKTKPKKRQEVHTPAALSATQQDMVTQEEDEYPDLYASAWENFTFDFDRIMAVLPAAT